MTMTSSKVQCQNLKVWVEIDIELSSQNRKAQNEIDIMKQEEKESIEAEDGSLSQYDRIEHAARPRSTTASCASVTGSSGPSHAQVNLDLLRGELGITDEELRGEQPPTPTGTQVLTTQDEEVVFGDRTQVEDTPRICYDGSSPVMHPTRRSTIDHNVHVNRANSVIDQHMRSMVTPMRTTATCNPTTFVTDPPRVERNAAYFVTTGTGEEGPPSDPSSSSSTTASLNGNNGGGPPNDPPGNPNNNGNDIGPPSPHRCRRCGRVHPEGPCPCSTCGQVHPPGQCPDNNDRIHPVECRHCGKASHDSKSCPTLPANYGSQVTRVINGRRLQVRDHGLRENEFTGRQCWNKFLRWKLTSEDRIAFDRAASGYVLAKSNKLCIVQIATNDQDILHNLLNTHNQLRSLKAHVNEYDIGDVFTVVLPIEDTSALYSKQYDLFVDYAKITPAMVALSNRYYNMWIDESFIPENLNLTYTLIKNNMDEVLYGQCLEEYEKYSDICRGGPLLFIICIHKINKVNAQYRDNMWTRVKQLEIRKVQGEDVNHVVSLLNAAYATFHAVSTDKDGMSCVPQDWSEQVIKILQTSSVSKFNEIFEHEEELANRAAARTLGHTVWPTHDELMTLASRQYERFKQANEWHVSKAVSKKEYLSQTSGIRDLSKAKCDNCGKTGHLSPACTQPKDPERCARNRQKRIEKLKQERSKNKSTSQANKASTSPSDLPVVKKTEDGNITIDGLVYKFNKEKTLYCADPKKEAERKARGAQTRAAKASKASTPAPTQTPPLAASAAIQGSPSTEEPRRNMSNFFSNLA